MKRPRVVLDTNVLVSALVFGGARWRRLRSGWQSRRFVPLASRETAAELIRVLCYPKFKLSAKERESLLADYLPYTEVVDVPTGIPGLPEIRDPEDRKFLELATAGKADVVISGDDDLLVLGPRWGRRLILSPGDFETWLSTHLDA